MATNLVVATPATAQDLSSIKRQSLLLLRDIAPSISGKTTARSHLGEQKTLETEQGKVFWGHLFSAREVTALTNLAPASREDPADRTAFPPRYLCLFVWKHHRWKFRQFLGDAYGLALHYRKDYPSVFLQATCQTGRYEGDYFSWYYNPKTGRLIRTHFENWGPCYLVGHYLCLAPGYQRLWHEITHWIYAYKNGRKGALLAQVYEKDTGPFGIEYHNPHSGETVDWSFDPVEGDSGRTAAAVTYVDPSGKSHEGQIIGEGDGSAGYVLELLTGLDSSLLEEHWANKLPRQPLKKEPIQATGDPEIVRRLQWPIGQTHQSP